MQIPAPDPAGLPAAADPLRDDSQEMNVDSAAPSNALSKGKALAAANSKSSKNGSHAFPGLALGSILATALLLRQVWHVRQRKLAPRRRPRKAHRLSDTAWIILGIGIALAVLVGGLLLSMLVLGIAAAQFGWVLLALFCTLLVSAVLFLLVAVILVAILASGIQGSGPAHGFGKGLAGVIGILIAIPIALFLGAIFLNLFLSAFLGIVIGIGMALLVWLIMAVALLGAVGVGILIARYLANRD